MADFARFHYIVGMDERNMQGLTRLAARAPHVEAQMLRMADFLTARGWKSIGQPRWTALKLSGLTAPDNGMMYASKPIDEWDCPYIYLFGGKDSHGQTYNTLYRGVIEWFRFKPLQ